MTDGNSQVTLSSYVHDTGLLIVQITGDLDSQSGLAIMELLASLNQEGMTIIFVTHDPVMAEFARRLIHIYDGRLLNDSRANLPPKTPEPQGSEPHPDDADD